MVTVPHPKMSLLFLSDERLWSFECCIADFSVYVVAEIVPTLLKSQLVRAIQFKSRA